MTDRYSRHRAIAGFDQDRLQQSHVIVVGAGAIGNEVVKNLCLLGVGRIDVHDLDRVERHNLTRSVLQREADLGRSKADVVVARAADLDPAVTLVAIDGDIRDTLAPRRAAAADVVIGAVDNFEARLWLNRLCHDVGTPWVNAAIDHRNASVETFPFAPASVDASPSTALPGPEAPACYECGLPDSVYARIAERYSCGGLLRAALAERIMPTTVITASIAGALAVDQALQLLARPTPAESIPESTAASRRQWLDTRAGASSVARLARREDCPGCAGQRPGQLGLVIAPGITVAGLARWARAEADGEPIALAEPLIRAAACSRCGQTPATKALVGRLGRRVSETATFCFQCGAESIAVELRDLVEPADLEALVAAIGDQPLPLAFARVGPHLVDAVIEPDPAPPPTR